MLVPGGSGHRHAARPGRPEPGGGQDWTATGQVAATGPHGDWQSEGGASSRASGTQWLLPPVPTSHSPGSPVSAQT